MTMNEMNIKTQAQREMNMRMPQKELEYRNGVVAQAIATGKADKLTSDWVCRALLQDVEDDFMTYEQAVAINNEYYNTIQMVARMF